MSKIVRQFMNGEIELLTGDDAHEFATKVQTQNLQTPIGNMALNSAIADQELHSGDVMKIIDQAFSPKN